MEKSAPKKNSVLTRQQPAGSTVMVTLDTTTAHRRCLPMTPSA